MNELVSNLRSRSSRRAIVALLLSAVLAPLGAPGQETSRREDPDLRNRADAIRASAEKLAKAQRIPWVTDVEEGFRLAKEERRPVFLYVITGDPLGDC